MLELGGKVFFDDVVEAMLGEGLLFHTHPHLQHLFDSIPPWFVILDKRVVLEGILGAFDVHFLERVRRVLKFEINNILRRHAQVRRLRHTEEPVQVRA